MELSERVGFWASIMNVVSPNWYVIICLSMLDIDIKVIFIEICGIFVLRPLVLQW